MSTNLASVEQAVVRSPARYTIGKLLGTGGAAVVHQAHDAILGHEVALKRLRADLKAKARHGELFKQEFFTLSELAHPHVVSVYDFGLDDEGPYYTMELLEGGDLLEKAPWDWRTACKTMRDICSALSLIHSRRLVYRDLSPRNVRCTNEGTAKLLDFGALSPMGRAKSFVGTPAISSPEAVHFQSLDARADLYSLGATFYFALTGQRPFPANTLAQLHEAWQRVPKRPSELVPEIPAALDALVTDLLQIDRALRPASAAEVMDRLTAIAGLERQEHAAGISSAFLSTPALVGRDASLGRFRRRIGNARRAGGSWLIVGQRGVGRTRFLDACVLEGKLLGLTVLRADASDGAGNEFSVARALGTQLAETLPDVAKRSAGEWLDGLSELVPALTETGEPPNGTAQRPVADLQRAMREWTLAVAAECPLMIAIDDLHRIDEASAAFIALLGREASAHPILVVATLPSAGDVHHSNAVRLFSHESRPIHLGALSSSRTERLLRSLFGDAPNVQTAAHRLFAVSKGLPRDILQLAQHLVDRGIARHQSGAWVLPQRLEDSALPGDMAEARRDKKKTLSRGALFLGRAFALGPEARYGFEQCVALTERGDGARAMSCLDELVRAEIVTLVQKDYSLSDASWREPLLEGIERPVANSIYSKLASVFALRHDERFRAAEYWIAAGEEERGLDALIAFAQSSVLETTPSIEAFARLVQSLPENFLELYDKGFELCRKYSRPATDAVALYARVAGIASQLPFDSSEYFSPLFGVLVRATGLDAYDVSDEATPPAVRLERSLTLAAERQARGESPIEPKVAIGFLGRTVASAVGNGSTTLSVDLLNNLPSLAPLVNLSPALAAWQSLAEGVRARMTGRSEYARNLYIRQIDRLRSPDRAGLDESYQKAQEFGIVQQLGILEAGMGLPSCLSRAEFLESSPLHRINAVRIRMLHHLWQGNPLEADLCRDRAELMTIERARRQSNEGGHLLRELLVNALTDDLTHVKRTLEAVEPLAVRAAGWRSVLHWARAEYERIRGDHAAALAHVETALGSMHRDGHPAWAETAGAHVKILAGLGRWQDARAHGIRYLETAAVRGIGYEKGYIRMPLALALAHLNLEEDARRESRAVVDALVALGSTGINLGLAYETCARICLRFGDSAGFNENVELCAEQYRAHAGAPVAARYERLVRDAAGVFERVSEIKPLDVWPEDDLAATLHGYTDPADRAKAVLQILLGNSGATEGFLFALESGEPLLLSHVSSRPLPLSIGKLARSYLVGECRADELTLLTEHGNTQVRSEWTVDGHHVYRPVLLSHATNGSLVITGLALLVTVPGKPYRSPMGIAARLSRLAMDQTGAVFIKD